MVSQDDDAGDEHSKKDYISSESKKRTITTPHTPQIPVTSNSTGYPSPPIDTSNEKQRVMIPVPSYNSDSTYTYNSSQHGQKDSNEYYFHSTEDRQEATKPVFESEKSNIDSLFFREKSREKSLIPVPSNELEGKRAGDWDENIIFPASDHGSESTDTRLWAQHREVKQGTQKLIMPVHYSSVKDDELQSEEVTDQHDTKAEEQPVAELKKETEINAAAQAKSEKYDALESKSLQEEISNLKESVQKTSVTQFLYNKEYKSIEEPAGYEIKDLDAYIEDFADDASLIHPKQPQKISAMDKSQVKTEKVKPVESLDKKDKEKAFSELTNKQYKSSEKPAKSETKDFDLSIKDYDDEDLIHPLKISAIDKSDVKTEKVKPLEYKEKEKEKGKSYGEITNKQFKDAEKPAKSETKDFVLTIKDFADEDSLLHPKQPQKISAVDKSHIKIGKEKPLESKDKEKEKLYGEITNKEYKSAEKPKKSETQDLETSVKDFADEASLIYPKQPKKMSELDKSQVKTEKVKPPESWEKKEKGKAYGEISNKQYKSGEKPIKSETQDLESSIKDFADETSLVHSKQPQKISKADKNQVIKIVKVKPPESWEKKDKEKPYGEITNKQYKNAEKPAKSETWDLDPTIKEFADEAALIHSKRPQKISAMDKSHVKTEKVKSSESLEKEKGKADNLTEYAKQEKTTTARKSSLQKDPSVKYAVSEGKRDVEIQRKVLTNNIKMKENQSEPKSKISDIKRIYRDEPSFEKEKQGRLTDDNVSAIEKYLQQEISKVSPEKVRRDMTEPTKGGENCAREIAKTDANTEGDLKTMPSKHSTELKVYKWKKIPLNEDDIKDLPSKHQEIKKASDALKPIKEGSVREQQKIPYQEGSSLREKKEFPPREKKEFPPKETKESLTKEMKESLPKETKESPPKETKGPPLKETKGPPPKDIKGFPPKETKGTPPIETKGSPPMETKGSPPMETKGSSPKDTKDSPPKETKRSPPKETKGSPPMETKGSPPMETKGSTPKETKGSPPMETKGSPPMETKGSPPMETKGSPPKDTKDSPPKETKGSPPKETKGSPPIETKGSPPIETKGSPPKVTGPSGKNDPNLHSSFDKYSTGMDESEEHSTFDKYFTRTNDSDYTRKNEPTMQSPSEKYGTVKIERTEELLHGKQNTHFKAESTKSTHPKKPDHANVSVPVSHYMVTDTKDTKLGSHKSQNINQQNEINNQSSKTITQGQATNLSTESTTRQGVTSQSITLLDSPPRYMVRDIKESEVTKPLGGVLQSGITENTTWPVHKLSSVNEKYLGKSGHPSSWGDAGTFLPWVTFAAQKKNGQNNQNNIPTEQSGHHTLQGNGYGSGNPLWTFIKDNFNSHTPRGRANMLEYLDLYNPKDQEVGFDIFFSLPNDDDGSDMEGSPEAAEELNNLDSSGQGNTLHSVSKATLLTVGLVAVWQMLKPKKCELTFQRCSECGSVTPMEKRR